MIQPSRPKSEQRVEVAPVVRALIGGDGDDRQDERQQDLRPDLGDLGDPAAAGEADAGREHLGEREAPDDQVGDVEVLAEHVRAGHAGRA